MKLTKEIIVDLEFKLIDAIKSNDIGFLETHLHDDLLFVMPDGQTITKQLDIDFHKSKQMIFENIIPTFENVVIIDDNTAIVTITYRIIGAMADNRINGDFKYIRFWKHFENNFQIIGGSCHQI